MALTTLWYLVAGVLCVAVVRGRRSLRVPVLGGCAMAAVATGGWLAYSTLHERVVHERLSVGLQLAGGVFSSGEHATTGTARLIRLRDGRRVVTLSRFSTSPGPDLRVRLAPTRRGTGGGTSGVADLGGLKGNRGDQQYDVPASFAARGATVLIWCRAFSALFGSAVLEER